MLTYQKLELLVGDDWTAEGERVFQQVINPATEEVLGELPHATAADLQIVLRTLERSWAGWRETSAFERGLLLKRWAELVRQRSEQIALIMTLEQGKPLAESRGEILNAADIIDWYAEEGKRAYGRTIPSRMRGHSQTVALEPIGPAALFVPWNFPGSGFCRKISSALAAGCTCVVKPSEETPGTGIALVRALVDAGLPTGVVQLVAGVPSHISRTLIASPVIRKISFTGSVGIGREIGQLAAQHLKPATLELGGHSPVIVLEDADVERAVALSVASKFRNAGQVCMSPTRFYVQADIHDRFLEQFVAASEALRVGDGRDEGTQMGPLANPRRIEAMSDLVSDARQAGATLKCGGERHGNRGYFWQPTVLSDVPEDCRIMVDEPFGPVAIINRFEAVDEAVTAANRLPFGLASYAFGREGAALQSVAERLEAGVVGINTYAIVAPETPFGGHKDSGHGLEGGSEGLLAFMKSKTISRM